MRNAESISLAESLIDELSQEYGDDNYHAKYLSVLIEKAKTKNLVAVGKKYVNVETIDIDGKKLNLSSVIGEGKYVLIDFWATWCSPCIAEMPYLLKDYAKYNSKGFEIFAISIDAKKELWETFSETENLPWINTIIQTEEKKNAQLKYNVSAIPANFLIGPEGTIIAMDLRGEKLEEKLNELLGD